MRFPSEFPIVLSKVGSYVLLRCRFMLSLVVDLVPIISISSNTQLKVTFVLSSVIVSTPWTDFTQFF